MPQADFQGVPAPAWWPPVSGKGFPSRNFFLGFLPPVYPTGGYASSRGEEEKTQYASIRHEAAFGGGACEGDSQN